MEANHPRLTTAKAFYVEISRARDRAELVTDDVQALRERLEAVTDERISALGGIGESVQPEHERDHGKDGKDQSGVEQPIPEASAPSPPERKTEPSMPRDRATELPAREKHIEMDMGL